MLAWLYGYTGVKRERERRREREREGERERTKEKERRYCFFLFFLRESISARSAAFAWMRARASIPWQQPLAVPFGFSFGATIFLYLDVTAR
jgi:hypothetical protein